MSSTNLLDITAYLEAEGRVQAACWLVEKEYLGICDQTACDAEPLLLATTEPFLDGCANDGVCLRLQTKASYQIIHALECLFLADRAGLMLAKLSPVSD